MDLVISAYCPVNCAGGGSQGTIPCYYELTVVNGGTMKNYFTHIDNITVGYSTEGYAELRVNRANVYKYTLGDTFNSMSIADSEAMFNAIVKALGGTAPPPSTYYILAENGNILNAENSDKLRTETP